MNKIVVVGCGKVGMEYIYSIMNQNLNIDEIVLIDQDHKKLAGKILDLKHCLFNLSNKCKIYEGDYSDCKNASIVCITVGPKVTPDMKTRLDSLNASNELFKQIIPKIKDSGFSGIYLVATNPLDIMCYTTWRYSGCNPYRVIGSGTLLDTARFKALISEKYNMNIEDISGYVLGEHGDSQFITWDLVNITGISKEDKEEMEKRVINFGYEVSDLLGYTAYGVATSLSRITKAIINDENVILPVSSFIETYGVYISTPSVINTYGIKRSNIVELSQDNINRLNSSVNILKTAIGKL